ncbi:hypothetical protein METSCH_A11740 [Metschnikowia aff. pulcherrima]|uniref:Outer spore wall assembly protein SHE10 n=1 Tax=Metschnikowia aff. pulcherrima TaxID=2163413 RepID=A0A4P6XIS8_9ASCO|nr:hypothetical protein METSCH_A11740 [Metschnikowia aff. pulcherrima]
MRLFSAAKRLAARAFWWCLVPYLIYLAVHGCASGDYTSNVISRHTCPPLQLAVYPAWHRHVQPKLFWIDEKLHVSSSVSSKLQPLRTRWEAYDDMYKVTQNADAVYELVASKASGAYESILRVVGPRVHLAFTALDHYYRKNVHPSVLYYGARYKYALETTVDSLGSRAKTDTLLALQYVKMGLTRANALFLTPVCAKIGNKACEYALVHKVIVASRSMYRLLLDKSSLVSTSLQLKKDFVRSEFRNLVKSDVFGKRYIRDRDELNTVFNYIQDIDLDATRSEILVESGTDTDVFDSSDIDDDEVPLTFTQTHTVTVTAEDEPESTSTEAVSEAIETGVETGIETGIETFESLQTFTTEPAEDEIVTFGSDSSQAQIEYELAYWQTRVQKALDLAVRSLETDFGPYLSLKTAELKDAISANFSTLLKENYQRYKEMGELIVAINKDSEYIRETNETIDEPKVDRQIMRDKIAAAYAIPEQMLKDVEQVLNEAHVEVMTQYYRVAQDTVDVLESFAETAILDFSSRLSGLLDILSHNEDFDDTMIWSAWKSFHSVKESIFEIRDKIFDDANAYKYNARGAKVPSGLEPWAEYLGKVNFHIRFLLKDNADYLQLVRAKANIAYQQREGLSYQLKQEEKARQEEAEAKIRASEELKRKAQQEERLKLDSIDIEASSSTFEFEAEQFATRKPSGEAIVDLTQSQFLLQKNSKDAEDEFLSGYKEKNEDVQQKITLDATSSDNIETKASQSSQSTQVFTVNPNEETSDECVRSKGSETQGEALSESFIQEFSKISDIIADVTSVNNQTEEEFSSGSLFADVIEESHVTEVTVTPVEDNTIFESSVELEPVGPEVNEIEEFASEDLAEAGEEKEFVEEADERLEMAGEREPVHDEL